MRTTNLCIDGTSVRSKPVMKNKEEFYDMIKPNPLLNILIPKYQNKDLSMIMNKQK